MEKKPDKNSITHIAATWTWRSHTHPYAITEGGRKNMGTIVLCRRIWVRARLGNATKWNGLRPYLSGAHAAVLSFQLSEDIVGVSPAQDASKERADAVGKEDQADLQRVVIVLVRESP